MLIIEGDIDAAQTLRRALESLGHLVHEAVDAPAGLAQFALFAPAVVFLHIDLPSMDGYELACRVRALPGGEAAFIVAVTGDAQENDRRRAHEAGFDAHVTKPVARHALESILQILSSHEARRQAR